MAATLVQRWPTLLLLAWLPLVKWGLAPGPLRALLFIGGGTALAAFAVWREGDRARVAALFRAPGRGVLAALSGYALLMAVATPLLYAPALQPFVPFVLYDLAALFDPLPIYLAFARGGPFPAPGEAMWVGLGSLAEEWIFRAVLFWRWLPATILATPPRLLPPLGVWARLLAVSLFFAALHWPQHPLSLLVALLGSLVLGALLWWRRNLALVATLHLLFNLRLLL